MAEIIHHWGSYFGVLDAASGMRTLEEHAARNPNAMLDATLPRPGLARSPQAEARVSGSCWIVDCPTGDGGAEFVNFDDPRFFCCRCRNAASEGKPLAVKLPTSKLRADVESVLLQRPDPQTRHWTPGETVADLKAENLLHGEAIS